MPVFKEAYHRLVTELQPRGVTLVAVSKTRTIDEIRELYELGHRDFGENYVQELKEKQAALPPDIRWHFIGHLQTNKVKHIASFIHLVQSAESRKLLKAMDSEGRKNNRIIHCLLQVHIAEEETKYGMDEKELHELLITDADEIHGLKNIKIAGLMGMASFSNDRDKVRTEFRQLKTFFNQYAKWPIAGCPWQILSMGMTLDYQIAVEEGSNMVRIGSLIFGERGGAV